jgi:hypothetical protein
MSNKLMIAILAMVCAFGLAACSKGPAEAALKAADAALEGVRADASVYVPDQLQTVEDSLAAARQSFEAGDYKQALAGAKDLPGKAEELAAAVTAKKEELTRSWEEMQGGLPNMVEAIQSRVDILSKSRRLPAGLDKATFENAKASLDTAKQTWSEATSAFGGGNLMDAVNKATAVKEKAAEIMAALGMQVPQAAQ